MATKKKASVKGADKGKSSRGEFVRNEVRQAIENGRFQPGQRVRETEVAEWLKVSRTPVREALRLLESEGLLTFIPWRGVVVAELDRHQIIELYEVRSALESLACGLAALYMSDNEVTLLGELVDRCERSADTVEIAKFNRRFHEAIYIGSHNRYLIQQLNTLRSSLALLQGTTYSVPGRKKAAHEEHRAMYEAISKHDQKTASALASKHLKGAELARLKMMSGLEE